jgi:hypothetical protein
MVRHPLHFHHRLSRQRLGQFNEGGKIPLHDVVEEPTDALIELGWIGQLLKSRIAHAAAFKSVGKRFSIISSGASVWPGRLQA